MKKEAAILGLGLFLGIAGKGCADFISDVNAEPGRGAKIEACPVGYEAKYQITDKTAIEQLGKIAAADGINDDFINMDNANEWGDDANQAGELVCSEPDFYGFGDYHYLLPAGIQAMERLQKLQDASVANNLPVGIEPVPQS